ncbi:DUF1479 domain protein [Fusarium fujikuroi]|nr:DUF1479 domain protein [Fusarium fujikuroi]
MALRHNTFSRQSTRRHSRLFGDVHPHLSDHGAERRVHGATA